MDQFEDKDTFLVKLPNKLKECLTNPRVFSLSKHDAIIGQVFQNQKKEPARNPENYDDDDVDLFPLSPQSQRSNKVVNDQDEIDCTLRLDMPTAPSKRQKTSDTTEAIFFNLKLPSLASCREQREKSNNWGLEVCETSDSMNKRKIKGQLKHKMVGEAILRPQVIRDQGQVEASKAAGNIMGNTLNDGRKQSIKIELIDTPIYAPPIIRLAEEKAVKDKRVAQSEDILQSRVLNLFRTEKLAWKVDEVSERLDQPKQPVKSMMEKICDFDPIRKHYVLKAIF